MDILDTYVIIVVISISASSVSEHTAFSILYMLIADSHNLKAFT
jgi:hypothetical protein